MTVSILLAAACALAYGLLVRRDPGMIRSGVKTAAVGFLALAALQLRAPSLLVSALALCALGDWCLSREGDRSFVAGVAAFAMGHLAYAALFLTAPESDLGRLLIAPAVWIVVGLGVLGLAMARILAPRAGPLRIPVLCYIPIILGMGGAALTLPMQGALAWGLPAALAFIASDLVLATEKFILPAGHRALKATPFVIWPLYWIAQAGFLVAFS